MGFGKESLHPSDSGLFSWRLNLIGPCRSLFISYSNVSLVPPHHLECGCQKSSWGISYQWRHENMHFHPKWICSPSLGEIAPDMTRSIIPFCVKGVTQNESHLYAESLHRPIRTTMNFPPENIDFLKAVPYLRKHVYIWRTKIQYKPQTSQGYSCRYLRWYIKNKQTRACCRAHTHTQIYRHKSLQNRKSAAQNWFVVGNLLLLSGITPWTD